MMNLLLDANVVMFLLVRPERVKPDLRSVIEANDGNCVSVAVPFELAIKHSLGKLPLPEKFSTFTEFFDDATKQLALSVLGFELSHFEVLSGLPFHHRDPFDRLMIAQALAEGMTLVSSDRQFARYDTLDLIAV